MKSRKFDWKMMAVTCVMCLLPALVGIVRYSAMVSSEYYVELGKNTLLFQNYLSILFLPVMLLGTTIVIDFLVDIERKNRINAPDFFKWCCPGICVFMQSMYINKCIYGVTEDVNFFICLASIASIIYGYYLSKCRLGAFIGIKNKWTSNNRMVWENTNKIAGIGMGIISLALMIASTMDIQNAITIVCICVIVLMLGPGPIAKIVSVYEQKRKIR